MDRNESAEVRLRAQFIAAQEGDAVRYREFLAALSAHLRAFFRRRMARWPDDVEDLVQETLLAIHNGRHTYHADQPLTAWVHTIARYKMVDFLRAHARNGALNDPLDEESAIFAFSDADAFDARRDLEQILQEVPEPQRRMLVMVKLAGVSVAETARVTGVSEASVKVGVHRTLKALVARFRREP
ncbi:MAG TPA: sigma-70 family RNA polymerase sigma factor [Ramlibacter sp.]|jgi:RNA polymerase sigma-70 factor (ECF subfamily)|nr:sigma-70 family RNA polymerase sigma factor [Ramlibacter sp.]